MSKDNCSFEENWKKRKEALYTHWTRGEPKNQIQLAFRNHWLLFNDFINSDSFNGGKRVLEVGCGRGSLSCYFSDAGYDVSLLDMSKDVIEVAKDIFSKNSLKGSFYTGDANKLEFPNSSFDIVFSIGLFEHFEDVEPAINEQIRVLDKGGLFIAYIVPKYKHNVQEKYRWVNEILKGYSERDDISNGAAKAPVYRSDKGSDAYIPYLERGGLINISTSGVYPIPMISHSIDFPFTLMPEASEKELVKYLNVLLSKNTEYTHSWMCDEGDGNAFVVWGYKE